MKSSLELEKEELEKIPKFKARPLNKKVITTAVEMKLMHRFLNPSFSLLLSYSNLGFEMKLTWYLV